MACSENAKDWTPMPPRWRLPRFFNDVELPQNLKVGVMAQATTPGTFKAVFDQFKLTPIDRSTR
jgi:hypothetical protein